MAQNQRSPRTNVHMEVDGQKLVITIDLTVQGIPSKSGKSLIVATTSGNQPVPGTKLTLGLNLYERIN